MKIMNSNLQNLFSLSRTRNFSLHSEFIPCIYSQLSAFRLSRNLGTSLIDYQNYYKQNAESSKHRNNSNLFNYFLTASAVGLSSIVFTWKSKDNEIYRCDGFFNFSFFNQKGDERFSNAPKQQQTGLKKIADFLGASKYSVDYDTREVLSYDTSTARGKIPEMVIYPECTEDVSEVLKLCDQYNIPVLPYGSGTSLEGNAVCMNGGIVVNMTRMKKIKRLSTDSCDVTVETGIQWMDLNEELKETGLFYPIDPGPGASIGGMISTRCSGTNAVRYGVMKDWVLSLTVVLADGTVMKLGSRARKDAAGYDLVRFFCGSDGTLGIITEATLKLAPIPKIETVAVCSFPDIKSACDCVNDVTKAGVQIGCAEMMDADSVACMNENLATPLPISPCVMFKFTGNEGTVEEAIKISEKIAKEHKGEDFIYRTKEAGQELWAARKYIFPNTQNSLSENNKILNTDVCVPTGMLSTLATMTKQDIQQANIQGLVFGHVGDGNFHTMIVFDPTNKAQKEKVFELYNKMIERAISMGGTCSGEHGIGVGKKKFLKLMYNEQTLDLMKRLKKVFDPKGLMNPGKIFD